MPQTNKLLLAAGLAEVALGAATGWPYALASADPERARALGIHSTARLRQWHLDLIALGGLTALAASAVPDLPRKVAYPLAIGAWTNANAFGVLVFRPEAKDRPLYRAAVGASFGITTWAFASLAATAARRATRELRHSVSDAATDGPRAPPRRPSDPGEPDAFKQLASSERVSSALGRRG